MSPVEWDAKCTRDRQRVATAGGFGSWKEKCAGDQQDAATTGGYNSWNEKCAGDQQDKKKRGKNKKDLGKSTGQTKAQAQLSALNKLTGDDKWKTFRSEGTHANKFGQQFYSHPSMKGGKSSMKGGKSAGKAMEFAEVFAKKRKHIEVPRIAEFFSAVSDKIAAPCSDSDFE